LAFHVHREDRGTMPAPKRQAVTAATAAKTAKAVVPSAKTSPSKVSAKAVPAKSASPKAASRPSVKAVKPAPKTASKPAAKVTAKPAAAAKKAPATTKAAAPKAAPAKTPSAKPAPAKAAPAKAAAAKKSPAPKPEKETITSPTAKATPTKAANSTPAKKATATKAAAKSAKAAPAEAKSAFDKKFLDEQREMLLEERAKYLRSSQLLKAEADSLMFEREPGDVQFDEESGEGDTLAVERDFDLALSAQARQQVDEIDAALARIDAGTYGLCRVSGLPIPKERLRAIPWATERVEYKVGGLGRR
jgi:RNA polymerase-binding transcription factor DksA